MVIKNKYDIGELVYLITDTEQHERIVTAIKVFPGGVLMYQLAMGGFDSSHYECEIDPDRNIKKSLDL